jgi:hypothetical protein
MKKDNLKVGILPRFNKAVEKVYEQERHDYAVGKLREKLEEFFEQKKFKNELHRKEYREVLDKILPHIDEIVSLYQKTGRDMTEKEFKDILEGRSKE